MTATLTSPASRVDAREAKQAARAFTAAQLRADGHVVFNPAEEDEREYGEGFNRSETGDLKDIPTFDLRKALLTDLTYILEQATAIALLPGWEQSRGAKIEQGLADALWIESASVADWIKRAQ